MESTEFCQRPSQHLTPRQRAPAASTCAIVIPTHNSVSSLRRCLLSIVEYCEPTVTIIVVDSGSTDGTRELLRHDFPQVVAIDESSNAWWTRAVNSGVRAALRLNCHYIITYNDDNIATRGLFKELIRTAERHPGCVIAAVCCYYNNPSQVFFAGRVRANSTDRFVYLNHNELVSTLPAGTRTVDLLHGMCTLWPASVFSEVGLFDELCFPHLFADDDLALRAANEGHELLVSLGARVLNDRGKTGINPYQPRPSLSKIWAMFASLKSMYQMNRHTRFLWRHRTNLWSFIKTWTSNYARLVSLVILSWVLSPQHYDRLCRSPREREHQ